MAFSTSRIFSNSKIMEAVAGTSCAYLPRVSCLRISNFRCHAFKEFEFENTIGPVVFTGANGVGKTTLLEALSLIAPGKGLRRAKLADLMNNRANSFGVFVNLNGVEIGTGANKFSNNHQRILKIDGREISEQSELLKYSKILWLSPEIERSFASDMASRRKFFDRAVSCFDNFHIYNLTQYNKALKEWSSLLKSGVKDDTWLSIYEKSLLSFGNRIMNSRRLMAERLNYDMENSASMFPQARIFFEEEDLCEGYFKEVRADFLEKGFIIGAHNQKIEIKDLKTGNLIEKCSTGEVKSSLVATFLSQARLLKDKGLILLLDDISAYLDKERRDYLLLELKNMRIQSFITGIDPNVFNIIRNEAEFFTI